MNVLSLFDGMSCGQIAFKELGVKIDNYYASEIDKYAIQQTQHNFPNTIQLGSVTDIRAKDLPKIDLLIGGSPCQGFSFAGKQLNFNDPRSALFFEFVRLKNELKPKYFLFENVNMKKEYLHVISEYLGIFPVRINSNLVSAQNRVRWYWTNIKTIETGLFNELWTGIEQPKDKGILLKDILQDESEIDDKYTISNKAIERINRRKWSMPQIEPDKTGCIGTTNNSGRLGIDKGTTLIKLDKQLNEKPDQNKAGCLTGGGHSGGNHSDMDIICVAMRGRNPENSSDRTTGAPTKQRLEPKTDGKTNCLTSVAKDNLIIQLNRSIESGGNQPYQQNRIYDINGQLPALTAQLGGRNNISDGYKLRRLTPTECARLQTVPNWYEWKFVSNRYFGYICSEYNTTRIWQQNARLVSAIGQYQINQLDYATCTTLDLLEQEQRNLIKLTGQKNVKLQDVIEMQQLKNTETFVYCITNDLRNTIVLNYPLNKKIRNVNIVIEKLETMEVSECATLIIEVSNSMVTRLKLKKERKRLEYVDINHVEMVEKNTGLLWKISWGENLKKEKLYTILTLINWIIQRKIYTYANPLLNTLFYIKNLKDVGRNCLSVDISNLKMENISSTSDTQIYRMLGNGWTVDIIKHIFNQMALKKPRGK